MSGYGFQEWSPFNPRNLDNEPVCRSFIGGMHNTYEGVDGSQWTPDGWVTEDCITDARGLYAHAVSDGSLIDALGTSAADILAALLTRMQTYNTKELVYENTVDVNLPAGGGLTAMTAILDIRNYRHLFVLLGNTGGANNITSCYVNFYEGAIGAYTPPNLGTTTTVLPGGSYGFQIIPVATVSMSQTEVAAPYMRVIAGSTNGTTARVHIWGIRC